MNDAWRMQQALAALHAGLRTMEQEDGEISLDISVDLPDEAAALEDAMRGVVRTALQAKALAVAAKAQATDLAARAARFDAREKRLRGVLMAGMDAMDWRSREWPEATVSLRPGSPGVVITDDALLPEAFVRVTRAPDKTVIGAALKNGATVPGAELANGMPVLTLKGT